LDESEKTQPFDKVFSNKFAKNCLKGITEAAQRGGGLRVLLQVRSLK
jgi:hypothetical protein